MGGRFCFSDDSHGTDQVALNYEKMFECVKRAGIRELYYLDRVSPSVKTHHERFPTLGWTSRAVEALGY